MLDDYIVEYYNVIEYSLVSTLRPLYEGYKITLRPSYKNVKWVPPSKVEIMGC